MTQFLDPRKLCDDYDDDDDDVFVALCIQHAMRMRQIIVCALPGSGMFFHLIS